MFLKYKSELYWLKEVKIISKQLIMIGAIFLIIK